MGLHRRRGWSVGKSIVVRSLTVQSVEEIMTSQRIPNTDSIEELARFWDTHDLTDFQAELQEVRTPVFSRRKESRVEVMLTAREAHALRRLAEAEGIKEAKLVREWVREKLRTSSVRKPPLQRSAQERRG